MHSTLKQFLKNSNFFTAYPDVFQSISMHSSSFHHLEVFLACMRIYVRDKPYATYSFPLILSGAKRRRMESYKVIMCLQRDPMLFFCVFITTRRRSGEVFAPTCIPPPFETAAISLYEYSAGSKNNEKNPLLYSLKNLHKLNSKEVQKITAAGKTLWIVPNK